MSERDPWADFEAGMRIVRNQPDRPLVVGPEFAAALREQGCEVPDVAEVLCPFCGEAATDGSCLRAAADRIAELEEKLSGAMAAVRAFDPGEALPEEAVDAALLVAMRIVDRQDRELARLEGQRRGELWAAREREETLAEALLFYAEEETWFATTIWADPPCGDIVTDYSYVRGEKWPGRRAREALEAVYVPENLADLVRERLPDRTGEAHYADVEAAFGREAGR